MSDPEDVFYQNTASGELKADAVSKLVPQPTSTFFVPVTHEAWRDTPCVYIVPTEDRAIPPMIQHMWVDRLKSEKGVLMEVEEMKSDHVPFLSVPEEMLEILKKVM